MVKMLLKIIRNINKYYFDFRNQDQEAIEVFK